MHIFSQLSHVRCTQIIKGSEFSRNVQFLRMSDFLEWLYFLDFIEPTMLQANTVKKQPTCITVTILTGETSSWIISRASRLHNYNLNINFCINVHVLSTPGWQLQHYTFTVNIQCNMLKTRSCKVSLKTNHLHLCMVIFTPGGAVC